jgi:hypothetical protein
MALVDTTVEQSLISSAGGEVLSKDFLENKDTEWVSILSKIIEQYNNTPHTALDNITPNQAISDPENGSMSCI